MIREEPPDSKSETLHSGPIFEQPILYVSGPTASGKSDLALKLAQALKGEILNVDSVQIYKKFNIGSAKVLCADRNGIPHHLVDWKEPGEAVNVKGFACAAQAALLDMNNRGTLPILCGGAGLYTTVLFHGLVELPASDPETRERLEKLTNLELYETLQQQDPQKAESLHVNDRVRLIRAVESVLVSGVTPSAVQEQHGFQQEHVSGLILVLWWDRPTLYARIDKRVEMMLNEGLIEETWMLLEAYGKDCHALRSLGYAEVLEYLEARLEKEKLAETIAKHTRRFAKRQMTYWRNEPTKRNWKAFPTMDSGAPLLGAEVTEGKSAKGLKGVPVFHYTFEELTERVAQRLSEPFDGNELWYLDASALWS